MSKKSKATCVQHISDRCPQPNVDDKEVEEKEEEEHTENKDNYDDDDSR
jgi:hypothetical protein